jgi:hypothetical protein
VQFFKYWRERVKESVVKARVITEAVVFTVLIVTGIIVFAFTTFPAEKTVSWTLLVVFGVVVVVEICFVSPYQNAKKLGQKIEELENRAKSEITVSFSCDTEQCVLFQSQTTMAIFRVIVHLGGDDSITNVRATIVALRKDGRKIRLHEPVKLRFHRSGASGELETMNPETDEPLDMLRIEHPGALSLALAWNYSNFDPHFCKEPAIYEMDVAISSSRLPFKFTFVCPWTGDFNTTKPYIKPLS